MMQATDFWNRDDHAQARWLDWPSVGWVLVEREMSASLVIVREVAGQGAAQVSFAQDDDMIETLAADRADEPLRVGVLPRAGGRRQHFTNPHVLQPLPERLTIDAVAIAKEVEDVAALVGGHDEDEEDGQLRGGVRGEIDRDEGGA